MLLMHRARGLQSPMLTIWHGIMTRVVAERCLLACLLSIAQLNKKHLLEVVF